MRKRLGRQTRKDMSLCLMARWQVETLQFSESICGEMFSLQRDMERPMLQPASNSEKGHDLRNIATWAVWHWENHCWWKALSLAREVHEELSPVGKMPRGCKKELWGVFTLRNNKWQKQYGKTWDWPHTMPPASSPLPMSRGRCEGWGGGSKVRLRKRGVVRGWCDLVVFSYCLTLIQFVIWFWFCCLN